MSDPNDLLTDEDLLALATIAQDPIATRLDILKRMRAYLSGGVWVTITPQKTQD